MIHFSCDNACLSCSVDGVVVDIMFTGSLDSFKKKIAYQEQEDGDWLLQLLILDSSPDKIYFYKYKCYCR